MPEQAAETDAVVEALCFVLPAHREEVEDLIRNVRAEAWDEGFDAGERDVFNHEQAGWKSDDPCIGNPYRLSLPPGAST